MNKRQPAYIICIEDILKGEFVKTEGWEPNYITTSFGMKVSRVNIIGSVVDKNEQDITIDDGTGIIKIRSFDSFPEFDTVGIGDFALIIGKIREYGEIYIAPEICRKVSTKWVEERKEEWKKIKTLWENKKIIQEDIKEKVEFKDASLPVEETKEESLLDKIITFIDSNDTGNGVSKNKILEVIPESKETLERLILEGDIFEVKPDVFKVLK